MEKIKIAIADDNRDLVGLMNEYISSQPNMEIVATAYNGKTCMDMLDKHEVDVLILDIIMPYLDGIAVLDSLKDDGRLNKIEVIMLSAFGQDSIMSQAAQFGASYFIMKPFEMERLVVQINHMMQNRKTPKQKKADKAARDEQITQKIKEIGVPPHIKGFLYIKEAVSLVLENPDNLNKVTKSLYPGIADNFDTTAARVERSIRHAIGITWTGNRISHISKTIGYSEEQLGSKPSNSRFIAMVADAIRIKSETKN